LRRQLEASERYARENGLTLDSSLRDIGVSGYKGVNAKTGALAKFLQLVEKGKIESGSVLIVESLDRLSREDVPKALPRFLSLISAGITVVTLGSSPQRYDSKSIEANPFMLIGSLVEMIRANEESSGRVNASERLGRARRRRRELAGR
jgi:DNA invertase Pin-like site-specific DNA recombinase